MPSLRTFSKKKALWSVLLFLFLVSGLTTASFAVTSYISSNGVRTVPTAKNPISAVYNPSNKELYVLSSGSNMVNVFDSTTNKIVANISIPSPLYAVFDSSNKAVYVSSETSMSVFIINSTTNTVNATIPNVSGLPNSGDNMAYNSFNHQVYVCCLSNHVIILQGTKIVAEARVPRGGTGVVYDTINHLVYVGSPLSGKIFIIDGHKDVNNITIAQVRNLSFDPADNTIWVQQSGSDIVVISGKTNTITATINSFNNEGVDNSGFSPQQGGQMFVSIAGNKTVSEFNALTFVWEKNFAVGKAPTGIVFDRANHEIYVMNVFGNSMSII